MTTIEGEFSVKMIPQTAQAEAGSDVIARFVLDKEYFGALSGKSVGQMLAVRTPVKDSAGYVAMEIVNATLDGHQGSFALQHSGTMHAGEQHLSLSVVPASATDALQGLSGTMDIIIENGKHRYRFHYTR
jgi:hypothetical protein